MTIMDLKDAVKNLVENSGMITFSGTVNWNCGEDCQDYDVTIQLVQGNRLGISVDFEDGTDQSNEAPEVSNVEDAMDVINDFLINDCNIFDFDEYIDVEYNKD